MLINLHTHTSFCDGKDAPEQLAEAALNGGFSAIGFSGHSYTAFDQSYCMQDTAGYIGEVNRLKAKYSGRLEVYLGAEEDMYAQVERERFDYIIGSCHYATKGEKHYALDSSAEHMRAAIDAFGGNALALAENYYSRFCDYILARRPDIIGHFDLITKYEESGLNEFLCNGEYHALAEKYLLKAMQAECIFEVNTGAMARGLRTAPYPHDRLLRLLCKNGGRIMLSSDCHDKNKLDFAFEETRGILKEIGFEYAYGICGGEFVKYKL